MILSDRTETIARLEEQLNSFDARVRSDALGVLLRLASRGEIALPAPKPEVNLHFHTFFSYNAHGWSPSRVAWEARKYGLEAAGKVDFDVLDGMEEFLEAAELLGLKAVAGLETRVFVKEYAAKVINSPGEPGIAYFMAAGCYRRPDEASEGEARITLLSLAATARKRNEELMSRVNAYLDPVKLDYANDVLPLTPSGNATERHLLAADLSVRSGRILLFRLHGAPWPRHCAIAVASDRIVHAQERLGVVEAPLTPAWQRRIAGAWSFPFED